MSEDRAVRALQALADHDRAQAAPPRVETRLIAAFRARKMQRRAGRIATGAVAAGVIAAALLAARWSPPASMEIRVAPPAAPAPEALAPPAVSAPPRIRTLHRVTPREYVTEFFPLMDPAPPFERGQILRVDLPASAMQSVGLPVPEERLADRVQADVLVGEEGMPRAIRFVRFDAK